MIDKEELTNKIMSELGLIDVINDEIIENIIISTLITQSQDSYLSLEEFLKTTHEIFNRLTRYDNLQDLLDDTSITEIMINGPDCIFIEKDGVLEKSNIQLSSREKLEDIIQQMVGRVNRSVNKTSPIVDARLEDGSRINIVLNPVAANGPIVTIRKFPDKRIHMNDLIKWNSINEEAAAFLQKLVQSRYNIFISGGTGSGKTTFLNVLSDYIPADERIVVIEDNIELQITNIPNIVRLESRNANTEGEGEITIRDLIKTSLRMRPDRVIVGEVRSAEAVDMIQAMNTGHDGSISTGHANSPTDMLARLETMVLMGMDIPLEAVARQLGSAVDIIVHLSRMRDKTRKVIEIDEILGFQNGEIKINTLYKFVEDKNGTQTDKVVGSLQKTGDLQKTGKLQCAGIAM